MPTGVYERTPARRKQMLENLAKARAVKAANKNGHHKEHSLNVPARVVNLRTVELHLRETLTLLRIVRQHYREMGFKA